MSLPKPAAPRICYEIFIRSFFDSNDDGIGDLSGITTKLDYLKDLGVEAIWLTPIHPSPSYHKYDVRDYYDVDPEYGTLSDFRELVREAHARGLAIYLDLIVNHTSIEHPWFVKARKSKVNFWRNFYWWKNEEEIDALGIAKRQTTDDSQEVYPWHENPGDAEKYYGMFYKGMPDLNYNSEDLRNAIAKVAAFWLNDIGVDGFRLDAARHIFPDWEKSKNLNFWRFFKETVCQIKPDAFTVGEVWAKADEVAPYFGQLRAAFNFDLSFELQKLLIEEKDDGLILRLMASHILFSRYNPRFIDAIMLTNHDQERIGSVVDNNKLKMKLAASILHTLPGQSYIYYGEEIGMLGLKPDEFIREPFLWTSETDDKGRTRWRSPKYSLDDKVDALSVQQTDPSSIYHHYKKVISLKKTHQAFSNIFGSNLEHYSMHDHELLSYIRTSEEKDFLVVHNLTSHKKPLNFKETPFSEIIFETGEPSSQDEYHLPPYATVVLLRERNRSSAS